MKLSTHLIQQFDKDQAEGGAKIALEQIYTRLSMELMQRTKKRYVKSFLADQAQGGTKSALYNTIHEAAEEILYGIGVRHIKTANKVFGKPRRRTVSRIGDVDAEHGAFHNMQVD